MSAELRIGLLLFSCNLSGCLELDLSCGSKRPRRFASLLHGHRPFSDYSRLLGLKYHRAHESARSDDWIMVQVWRLDASKHKGGEHFTYELPGAIKTVSRPWHFTVTQPSINQPAGTSTKTDLSRCLLFRSSTISSLLVRSLHFSMHGTLVSALGTSHLRRSLPLQCLSV
jgi:hypothetical protein